MIRKILLIVPDELAEAIKKDLDAHPKALEGGIEGFLNQYVEDLIDSGHANGDCPTFIAKDITDTHVLIPLCTACGAIPEPTGTEPYPDAIQGYVCHKCGHHFQG